MSDLISRSALIESFEPDHHQDWYTPWIIEKINEQPTVDAKPVVHGEWIKKAVNNDGVINTVACSVCGTYQPLGSWDYYEYCSYCGAKMRKVVE